MQTATLVTPEPRARSLSPEDVSDGISAIAATYARPDSAGVCVADGMVPIHCPRANVTVLLAWCCWPPPAR